MSHIVAKLYQFFRFNHVRRKNPFPEFSSQRTSALRIDEELEELIRSTVLIHNVVMTASSTEQWEASCLVNDASGTTSSFFQDVTPFIVFHRVVHQRHLLHL
jgi:hypothetical protein